jgi:hypothetical protein
MHGGAKVRLRHEFQVVDEGTAVRYHFEMYDPEFKTLIHGVHSYLARDASGRVATVTYSTLFGLGSFEMTPDDDGVLALAGESDDGHRLTVTLVEEDDGSLFLTVFWRDVEFLPPDQRVPSMSGILKRLQSWKPSR